MGARDNDICSRRTMREGQDLKKAGTGRFAVSDAIRESRG